MSGKITFEAEVNKQGRTGTSSKEPHRWRLDSEDNTKNSQHYFLIIRLLVCLFYEIRLSAIVDFYY